MKEDHFLVLELAVNRDNVYDELMTVVVQVQRSRFGLCIIGL